MKNQIRNISKDIEINGEQYVNIHINTTDGDIEFLVTQINYLYDENQKIKVQSRNKEEEMRKSIANVSHDLRTPLTSIRGYLQLIKAEDMSDEEKKIYIDVMEKRTKNLDELINNFYELSRLEENNYKINFEKVNLKSILSENIAMFYDEFAKRGMEPEIYMEDNITDIIADKRAVNRIFSNVINNIFKHGAGKVKIVLKNHGDCILSEFQNYAPNLKQSDVESVFQRFFTGDISRNSNNSGIGLTVVKSLVSKLGNEVEAHVKDNNFTITITWLINNKNL